MIESSKMNLTDQYYKWIEWSEEDQTYIGKCPDLITGIHSDNPAQLYSELCDVIEDVIQHFVKEGRELPPPHIRPMREVV
jgi:predicted RNase H-like HicB family nuclease